jgi:hypothetical protein
LVVSVEPRDDAAAADQATLEPILPTALLLRELAGAAISIGVRDGMWVSRESSLERFLVNRAIGRYRVRQPPRS